MAERVVDILETIEIDAQQRREAFVPIGARNRLVEPIVQQQAIRQAGQRVIIGLTYQTPLIGAAQFDIALQLDIHVAQIGIGLLQAARHVVDGRYRMVQLISALWCGPVQAERRRRLPPIVVIDVIGNGE